MVLPHPPPPPPKKSGAAVLSIHSHAVATPAKTTRHHTCALARHTDTTERSRVFRLTCRVRGQEDVAAAPDGVHDGLDQLRLPQFAARAADQGVVGVGDEHARAGEGAQRRRPEMSVFFVVCSTTRRQRGDTRARRTPSCRQRGEASEGEGGGGGGAGRAKGQ